MMIKNILIMMIWVFLSVAGEDKALTFKYIPRMPSDKRINPRVLSAKMVSALLFGGMRGMIVDLTWMYVDTLWHEARFYKLPPLYEMITAVQPEYIEGWVMGGWHMAYNMAYELPKTPNLTPTMKNKIELEWVYRGIEFLKSGTELNPENAQLYFEIGWTYYHRLKDYKDSIPWFQKSSEQKDATWVTSRLIAYAYEKSGDSTMAYKTWLSLKKHPSYQEAYAKKLIDTNVSRLEQILGAKPCATP